MTGSEFRAWRKRCGYTIKAMAAEFRVGERTLVDWEQRGERAIPPVIDLAAETVKKNLMWTRKPLDIARISR